MTWAEAASAAFLTLLFPGEGVVSALLALLGAILGGPSVAVAGLVAGLGAERVRSYGRARRREAEERSDAEALLVRIRQRVRAGEPVAASLEEALGTRGLEDLDAVLHTLASRLPASLRAHGTILWQVSLRRGGRVDRLVDMLLVQLRAERALSHQLEAAFAGPRGTAIILASAPWVALVGLRFTVPTFFHILSHTLLGSFTLLLVAGVEAGVLASLWPGGGLR